MLPDDETARLCNDSRIVAETEPDCTTQAWRKLVLNAAANPLTLLTGRRLDVLGEPSVAELTVGHYRTPSGRVVDGHGITPDLVAGDDAERRAETVLSGLGGGA